MDAPRRQLSRAEAAIIMAVIVGGIGCCGGVLYFGSQPKNGIRVEDLRRDAEARLPIGSSRQQVHDWFASHQIAFGDPAGPGTKKSAYTASIPNDDWFTSAWINIYLEFDETDRLQSIRIERFWIAL